MNLIVAFLAPLFLSASGGDIYFARMAALETVGAYRARNPADLIAIAQIIAFGLSALGSLSLAMEDDLSISMTLRLRGNAVALSRAAEQNRRALRQTRAVAHQQETLDPAGRVEPAEPAFPAEPAGRTEPAEPDEARYEAKIVAAVTAAQSMTAATLARCQTEPAAAPVPVPASSLAISPSAATTLPPSAPLARALTAPMTTAEQWQAMWASAMTDVAGEYAAGLQNLPPAERRTASRRAAALSGCANQLIAGHISPPPGSENPAASTLSNTL